MTEHCIETCEIDGIENPALAYAKTYTLRGVEYGKKGFFTEAVNYFSEAILSAPDYARAYGNRGEACLDLGNYNEALSDFKKVLSMDSDLYWVKGKLRLLMG